MVPALWVSPRVAAALGAAAFSHFFLFFRLLLSSFGARKLRWGLGHLLLARVLGVLPGLGSPLGLDLRIALWDPRRWGPRDEAAGRPHGRGTLLQGGRAPALRRRGLIAWGVARGARALRAIARARGELQEAGPESSKDGTEHLGGVAWSLLGRGSMALLGRHALRGGIGMSLGS